MTLYTIAYALIKRDYLNPCLSAAAYWGWMFTPVPVLGACMVRTPPPRNPRLPLPRANPCLGPAW